MLPSGFQQKIEEGWEAFTSQINGMQLFPITLTKNTKFQDITPRPIPSCIDFHYNGEARKKDKSESDKENDDIEEPEGSLFHDLTINGSSLTSTSRPTSKSRESRPSKQMRSLSPSPNSPRRSPSRIPVRIEQFYQDSNNNAQETPSGVLSAPVAVKVNPSYIFFTGHSHGRDSIHSFSSNSCLETKKAHDQTKNDQIQRVPLSRPALYGSKQELSLGRQEERSLFPDTFREKGHSLIEDLSDIRISSGTMKLREERVNVTKIPSGNQVNCRNISRTETPAHTDKIGTRESGTTLFRTVGNNKQGKLGKRDSISSLNTSAFENENYSRSSAGNRSCPVVSYKNDTDEDLNARLQELINRRGRHQVRSHEICPVKTFC